MNPETIEKMLERLEKGLQKRVEKHNEDTKDCVEIVVMWQYAKGKCMLTPKANEHFEKCPICQRRFETFKKG